MQFPAGYALSFIHHHTEVLFTVQGEPDGDLCITCEHTLFVQRFSGHTKCFHPFISAPFVPDPTDENYDYFYNLKAGILKAYSELTQHDK